MGKPEARGQESVAVLLSRKVAAMISAGVWWVIGGGVVLLLFVALYEFSGWRVCVLFYKGEIEIAVLDYDPQEKPKEIEG